MIPKLWRTSYGMCEDVCLCSDGMLWSMVEDGRQVQWKQRLLGLSRAMREELQREAHRPEKGILIRMLPYPTVINTSADSDSSCRDEAWEWKCILISMVKSCTCIMEKWLSYPVLMTWCKSFRQKSSSLIREVERLYCNSITSYFFVTVLIIF